MAVTFASANTQAATLTITPNLFDFGLVEVGASSAPLNIEIETFADGTMDEELVGLDLFFSGDIGDFNVVQNSSACEPVGAGGICDFDITFEPLSTGFKFMFLDVVALFDDNYQSITIDLFESGFYFGDGVTPIDVIPLPAALPLFAGGLGLMGIMGWRRKQSAAA